jgi:hypothetical protein
MANFTPPGIALKRITPWGIDYALACNGVAGLE